MSNKKILSNIRERIALDNFKVEYVRHKRNKKVALVTASATAVILAGVLTIKTMKKRVKAQ